MSKSTIKSYLDNVNAAKETIIQLPISDTESLEVKIKAFLSIEDTVSLVNSVVEAIVADNNYQPELLEFVWWKGIVAFYTDLKVSEIDNDVLACLIYSSDLPSLILKNISEKQKNDIKKAIEKGIEYKREEMLLKQKLALDKALEDIEFCSNQFKQLVEVFHGFDMKEAFDTLKNVSSLNEEKLVNNIMEYKNKMNENSIDNLQDGQNG